MWRDSDDIFWKDKATVFLAHNQAMISLPKGIVIQIQTENQGRIQNFS